MPDQGAGSTSTESLSQETSQQNTPKPILNHPASNQMSGWKTSFMKYLASRSPTSKSQPINPSQTSKTMAGAADPNVPGGPKEIQALAQNAQAQRQPIANPKTAAHNPPKEASMNKIDPRRVETVRVLLKVAACVAKAKKKKVHMTMRGGYKKAEEERVPGTSVAAPMTAGAIGAGLDIGGTAIMRNLPKLIKHLPPEQQIEVMTSLAQNPGLKQQLVRSVGAGKFKAYGVRPAVTGMRIAGPVWAGAGAAKHEGGAGRGAAVGAGTGAGIATLAQLAAAIGARKTPGGATSALKQIPLRALGGSGGGAVLGAIGGGVQKHKRLEAQGKTRKQLKEKKEPKEKKEAQLRLVFRKVAQLKQAVDPVTQAAPAAAKWGWKGGLAALLGIPLAAAGVAVGAAPLVRAGRHHLEYAMNPMYKQQYDFQKMLTSPQMMMMNMMRGYGGYGGYGGALPPILNPEDRQMLQHATYLKGLRSRAKSMQEMLD